MKLSSAAKDAQSYIYRQFNVLAREILCIERHLEWRNIKPLSLNEMLCYSRQFLVHFITLPSQSFFLVIADAPYVFGYRITSEAHALHRQQ